MNLAYVRVSTQEQNESRQMVSLERFGIEKWFIEKVSASTAERPKLQEMLEFSRAGDVIYVHDFSRLARNTADLLRIIEQLGAKEVTLISATEDFNTGTATGKLMLTMLAAINEFERNILLERQREGIEQAKLRGVYHGRPKIPIPDNFGYIMENRRWNAYQNKGCCIARCFSYCSAKYDGRIQSADILKICRFPRWV